MKLCKKCDTEKDESEFNKNAKSKDGKQDYCRSCQREYAKPYRRANLKAFAKRANEYRGRNPDVVAAVKKTNHSIRIGEMERLPCRICGDPKSEAHHADYKKWDEVDFLCNWHHNQEHVRINA